MGAPRKDLHVSLRQALTFLRQKQPARMLHIAYPPRGIRKAASAGLEATVARVRFQDDRRGSRARFRVCPGSHSCRLGTYPDQRKAKFGVKKSLADRSSMSELATSRTGHLHGAWARTEPDVEEIDALRNEALQLLASIRPPVSPLKELHIRHRAGWLIVLADRMERDRAMIKSGVPRLTHTRALPATAQVLNLTPRLDRSNNWEAAKQGGR